jgi:hypothetical protein
MWGVADVGCALGIAFAVCALPETRFLVPNACGHHLQSAFGLTCDAMPALKLMRGCGLGMLGRLLG